MREKENYEKQNFSIKKYKRYYKSGFELFVGKCFIKVNLKKSFWPSETEWRLHSVLSFLLCVSHDLLCSIPGLITATVHWDVLMPEMMSWGPKDKLFLSRMWWFSAERVEGEESCRVFHIGTLMCDLALYLQGSDCHEPMLPTHCILKNKILETWLLYLL